MPSIIINGREICHPLKITKNKKQEKYCDGLDCAYCLDVDCPKTAIIVDGVNVRHCQYYRFEKCSNTDSLCSVNRYCYYKELQREIKKNKNLIKISDIRQETIIKLARRKKELEQQLYKLAERNNTLSLRIEELEQENEELKKKINTYACSANCHKYLEADKYRQALNVIKDFAFEECERECDFNFCKGETNETACVIYKIKNTIDEVLCAIQ